MALPICDTVEDMQFCFTPAAQRALAYGSGWSCRAGHDELEAKALLLGLLCEPECRAAVMLARVAVDAPLVRRQWPGLSCDAPPHEGLPPPKPLSSDVELSLRLASDRLQGLPQPLELATEHVLLGLAAADHEVAVWLRQRGMDPDRLEAEIRELYGCQVEGGNDNSNSRGLTAPGEEPEDSAAFQRLLALDYSPRSTAILRVVDAAANRAREGLRVVEDHVRLVLDDRHLTGLCKQLRHDLADALAGVSLDYRLAARETQADVGTSLTTPSERRRVSLTSVLAADFARLQESLRSLEEYGKLIDPERGSWGGGCTATAGAAVQLPPQLSDRFKQLRYRAYTLQRAVDITRHSIQRLAAARLCVLLDGRQSPDEFQRLARSLVDAGVHMIQLRDKQLSDREVLARARLLRAATRAAGTLCIINDRPDLAALSAADGVHVGQFDAAVKDARRIVGPEALVGVSTHNIEQARQAVLDGANYIGVGPTFPSDTKAFEQFPGVELLRAVAAEIRLPAFAIGGISRENLAEVLAAGFTRVAVSSAVTSADDPAQAARELLAAMTGEN